jgi:hypothetical protein
LSGTVASAVAPSLNVTVPVGVPPLPDTVAVKVTESPTLLGFFDEVIVVVVAVRTLWFVVAELGEKLPFPGL